MLEVLDNGQGFEAINGVGKGRYGLHTMRERAMLLGGELTVMSKPGKGTRVKVEVQR